MHALELHYKNKHGSSVLNISLIRALNLRDSETAAAGDPSFSLSFIVKIARLQIAQPQITVRQPFPHVFFREFIYEGNLK